MMPLQAKKEEDEHLEQQFQQSLSIQPTISPLIDSEDQSHLQRNQLYINRGINLSLFQPRVELSGWPVSHIMRTVYVKSNPKKGRCLFATKTYQPGDIIYAEHPTFVALPVKDQNLWDKIEAINAETPLELPPTWYFAAILCYLHKDENIMNICMKKWIPSIKSDQEYLEPISVLSKLNLQDFIDYKEFYKLLLSWRYNSFGHHADTQGLVLYNITSMIAHSCEPNATWIFGEEDAFVLRARVTIEKGEEITISYLGDDETLRPTPYRRERLSSWLFHCQCSKCSDEKDWSRGFRCQRCGEGNWFVRDVGAVEGLERESAARERRGEERRGGEGRGERRNTEETRMCLIMDRKNLMRQKEKIDELLMELEDFDEGRGEIEREGRERREVIEGEIREIDKLLREIEMEESFYQEGDDEPIYWSLEEILEMQEAIAKGRYSSTSPFSPSSLPSETIPTWTYSTECDRCCVRPSRTTLKELVHLELLYTERFNTCTTDDMEDLLSVWTEGSRIFNSHYLTFSYCNLISEGLKLQNEILLACEYIEKVIHLMKNFYKTPSFALAWKYDELGDLLSSLSTLSSLSSPSPSPPLSLPSSPPLPLPSLTLLFPSIQKNLQSEEIKANCPPHLESIATYLPSPLLINVLSSYENSYKIFSILCGNNHSYSLQSLEKWNNICIALNAQNKR